MTTVSQLLWTDAGSPEVQKEAVECDATCAMCALTVPRGVPVRDAFGPGFTDWDKLPAPSAPVVCVACVWMMGRTPPFTLRTWTVLYRDDWTAPPNNAKAQYHVGPRTWLTTKADMSGVVETLLAPPSVPWVLAVADSGQLHTLPFCRINTGGEWVVRFEREDVRSTPRAFAEVLYHATSLLVAGFIREDIYSLAPHPSKLAKHGLAKWREHAEPLRRYARSATLHLAITLTRKETYEDTQGRADRARREAGARADEQREHGPDIAHRLVAAGEVRAAGRDRQSDDVGGAGRHDVPQARSANPPQRLRQGDLFSGLGW